MKRAVELIRTAYRHVHRTIGFSQTPDAKHILVVSYVAVVLSLMPEVDMIVRVTLVPYRRNLSAVVPF